MKYEQRALRRAWTELLLLILGSLLYCYYDLKQAAHPVWFNWLYAGLVVAGVLLLIHRHQIVSTGSVYNSARNGVPHAGQCAVALLLVALPLFENVGEARDRRDAQRVHPGMTESQMFSQLGDFFHQASEYREGTTTHTFRKVMRYYYYWRVTVTVREGRVVARTIKAYSLKLPTLDWMYHYSDRTP